MLIFQEIGVGSYLNMGSNLDEYSMYTIKMI